MAAQVLDMFGNIYLMRSHKIAFKSTTAECRETNNHRVGIISFRKFVDVCLTKFENNPTLPYRISHQVLVTTKLFTG